MNPVVIRSAAAILSLILGICGVALAQPQVTPRALGSVPTAPSATSTVPNDYLIGPGDALQIYVFRNPELTTAVPVRPDGKITTPLVQDMIAVGKTPSQLARDIEQVLAEYVKSPQVNVIVTTAISSFSQVKVVGQVRTQQSVAYREGMTVMDAILASGGLSDFAAGNRAKIVRTENGKQQEIRIKLADLLNKGDLKQNLTLKPGDVIVVPQSRF